MACQENISDQCPPQHKNITRTRSVSSAGKLKAIAARVLFIRLPKKPTQVLSIERLRRSLFRRNKFPVTEVDNNIATQQLDQRKSPIHMCTAPIENEQLQVSVTFLQKVVRSLQHEHELRRATGVHENSIRRLNTQSRQLQYVRKTMFRMLDWLEEEVEYLEAQACREDEEIASHKKRIVHYSDQLILVAQAISNIECQTINLNKNLDEIVNEGRSNRLLVEERLCKLLDIRSMPDLLLTRDLEMQQPIDPSHLQNYEENCDQFLQNVLHQTLSEACKYPLQRMDDWQIHLCELESRRNQHREALGDLLTYEAEIVSCRDSTISEATSQKSEVNRTAVALADAIQGARYAGILCRSTGSLIDKDEMSASDYEAQFDCNIADNEISPDEIEKCLERRRLVTEDWLADANLEQNPEQLEPNTPLTPGTSDFQGTLREVRVEDSVSVADSIETCQIPTPSDMTENSEEVGLRGIQLLLAQKRAAVRKKRQDARASESTSDIMLATLFIRDAIL